MLSALTQTQSVVPAGEAVSWLQLITGAVLFAGILAVAIVYVWSQARRSYVTELEHLANTRGENISDLEKRVSQLEGEMAAVRKLKAEEIADKVIEALWSGGHLRRRATDPQLPDTPHEGVL